MIIAKLGLSQKLMDDGPSGHLSLCDDWLYRDGIQILKMIIQALLIVTDTKLSPTVLLSK